MNRRDAEIAVKMYGLASPVLVEAYCHIANAGRWMEAYDRAEGAAVARELILKKATDCVWRANRCLDILWQAD